MLIKIQKKKKLNFTIIRIHLTLILLIHHKILEIFNYFNNFKKN